MMWKIFSVILLTCFCIPFDVMADNLDDGMDLFSQGKYESALPLIAPYEENGGWVVQMVIQTINKAIPHHPIIGNGEAAENLRDFYKVAPGIMNKISSKEELFSFEQERDILEYGYKKEIENNSVHQDGAATQQLADFNKSVPGMIREIDAMPSGPLKSAVWKEFNQQKTNLEMMALVEKQANGESNPSLEYLSRNDENELRMNQSQEQSEKIEQQQQEMAARIEANEIFSYPHIGQ